MPKVPKVNSFTTQPLNHLTTQLLSSFILAQRPCVFIEKIKAPRDINDPAKTKLQSCHCEERSDVAIYPIEIASHSFAMTSMNSSRLNATWYKTIRTNLRQPSLSPFLAFNKKPVTRLA